MIIEPIGVIYTPYDKKEDCPIQPVYVPDVTGSVEVFEKYSDGLKDIELFSHIYLFYHFNRAGELRLIRPTFLDDEPHGIFASRHPCRPNSIGMSIVRLLKRDNNILLVEGVDVLDGTPLLDIKPYVPRFDHIETATEGWIKGKPLREKPKARE